MTARRRRSGWDQTERDAYLVSRTMGDISAARRGRLGQRLIRRRLTRGLFRALMRSGK